MARQDQRWRRGVERGGGRRWFLRPATISTNARVLVFIPVRTCMKIGKGHGLRFFFSFSATYKQAHTLEGASDGQKDNSLSTGRLSCPTLARAPEKAETGATTEIPNSTFPPFCRRKNGIAYNAHIRYEYGIFETIYW